MDKGDESRPFRYCLRPVVIDFCEAGQGPARILQGKAKTRPPQLRDVPNHDRAVNALTSLKPLVSQRPFGRLGSQTRLLVLFSDLLRSDFEEFLRARLVAFATFEEP